MFSLTNLLSIFNTKVLFTGFGYTIISFLAYAVTILLVELVFRIYPHASLTLLLFPTVELWFEIAGIFI